MAECLVLLTTTAVLIGLSTGTPESEIVVRNTTFPRRPGGDLRLTCTTKSDDDELYWAFVSPLTQAMRQINDDYDRPMKYQITYDENSLTSNLTVFNVQKSDQGIYRCIDKSRDDYHDFIFDMPLGPSIIVSKRDPSVGDDLTIMCMVEGYTNDEIQWSYTEMNGKHHSADEFVDRFREDAYTRSNTNKNKTGSYLVLLFKGIDVQTSGKYMCVAEGISVSEMIYVRGTEINCEVDTLHVEPGSDAIFSCQIVTLTPFGIANITVRKYVGQSTIGRSIDSRRELVRLAKQNDGLTTNLTFSVGATTADDDARYRIAIKGIGDQYIWFNLTIGQSVAKHCDRGKCQGNYICDMNGFCICPQGMKPDPSSKSMCTESDDSRDDDDDDDDGRGGRDDVTIVKHSSVATAVGVSMGVLGCIILIILGFVCYWRKKKQKLAALNAQARGHYMDPSLMYQYEYHSEANHLKENPTFDNPGYLAPPMRMQLRKENTYVDTERARLEFPREQLQLGVDLGQGRFGKVIQARAMNITGAGKWERVAVKTCRGTATDSEKQDLYQELEIMRKIPDHPNVVHLLGCCSKTDPLYIIMEYVQRGSMLNYLRKCRPSSRMSGNSAISTLPSTSSFMQPRAKDLTIFALQIARGMAHIGAIGIIHRDLAARNILLGTDFTCKICDFGLARDVEGVDVYERVSKGPLPIRWMAPEALADNMYTRKSDVWSYGILLWEIVTLGATPYTGMSAMEVMRHVLQGHNLPRPLHCKSEMYELMECCWTDADERPTFVDIVTHQEELMDDDYIILSDYDENDYGWLDSYTLDERV